MMDSLRRSSTRIGTAQRILAWPLRKDGTHTSRSANDADMYYMLRWSRRWGTYMVDDAATKGDMMRCDTMRYDTVWCEYDMQSTVLCPAVPCRAVLCCAVRCCAVLCCAVLCCAVLCCAVLCCAVLCCAVRCCAVLRCAALRCAAMQCHIMYTLYCTAPRRTERHCNVMQCTVTLRHVTLCFKWCLHCYVMPHCIMSQHVA